MGVTAGDVDNDGDVDLYVTNLDGNTFWQNQGRGTFKDRTQEAGLALEAFSTSCLFVDIDQDGFLDLYVANYALFDETKPPPCFSPTSAEDYCGPSAFPHQADAFVFEFAQRYLSGRLFSTQRGPCRRWVGGGFPGCGSRWQA